LSAQLSSMFSFGNSHPKEKNKRIQQKCCKAE
jgi:hypothetical protein